MSTSAVITANESNVHDFRLPKTVISRFIAKKTFRSAVLWGAVFGIYVASKAAGYAAAYPTASDKLKIATAFGNNIGLSALLGKSAYLTTVSGYVVWNTLMVVTIVGAIWAFLLATKTFRGEEDNGRWELLLSGQTTARKAAANALLGLATSLAALFAVAVVAFIAVGRIHSANFAPGAAVFFALSTVCGAAIFLAVGAFASQLMPTRSRAATLSAAVFGIFFLLRAMADSTRARWLLDVSPLGWIERLQPFNASQPIWLLPIGLLVLGLAVLTIFFAGERDLGSSTFADKDSGKPKLRLLNKPLPIAWRLTRNSTLSWLAGIGLFSFFLHF